MREQIIKRSKPQLGLLALASALAVIGGIYILYRYQATQGLLVAIGGIIFFVAMLHSYRLDEPVLILDKEGITVLNFRVGKILWSDLRSIRIVQPPRMGKVLCLDLYDEAAYLTRQIDPPPKLARQINRLYGLSTFHIMTSGLEVSAETLYQDINYHLKRNAAKMLISS